MTLGRPRTRVRPTCEVCGQEVKRVRGDRRQRFCSLVCRDQVVPFTRRNRVGCVCGSCGKRFEKRPSELAAGRGKFCSKACAGVGRPIGGRQSAVAAEAIRLFQATTGRGTPEHRVGRWSIDLALMPERIAVELDGVYWHSLPAMQDRDRRKDAALQAKGWQVVRIPIPARATAQSVAEAMTSAVVGRIAA